MYNMKYFHTLGLSQHCCFILKCEMIILLFKRHHLLFVENIHLTYFTTTTPKKNNYYQSSLHSKWNEEIIPWPKGTQNIKRKKIHTRKIAFGKDASLGQIRTISPVLFNKSNRLLCDGSIYLLFWCISCLLTQNSRTLANIKIQNHRTTKH